MSELNEAIQKVLRQFDWGDFGMDEMEIGLHDYPEDQEWVQWLANAIENEII